MEALGKEQARGLGDAEISTECFANWLAMLLMTDHIVLFLLAELLDRLASGHLLVVLIFLSCKDLCSLLLETAGTSRNCQRSAITFDGLRAQLFSL